MRDIQHVLGGSLDGGSSGRFAPVYDPASGEPAARVALADGATVAHAVACAADAAADWAAMPPPRRARVLFRFKTLLEERADDLARAIVSEHGKTLPDAHGEVQRGLEVVEFACGIPQTLKGEYSENVGSGVDSWSVRQPVGVCAGITPFNFPAMVPLWMFPVAIACGNTFVLKPSERDPSCSVLLAEMFAKAGGPAGVLNVVHGDKVAVDALLADPRVGAVSFVGSTPVARYVYERCAQAGKRVQALGGAKNHAVVLPDADLDGAADALVGAGFGSAGERCMAISAVVAVNDCADALVERLAARTRALRIGSGLQDGIDMGPVITGAHLERVRGFVDSGETEGARLVVDGRSAVVPGRGFFIGGTLFDGVTPAMSIYREEIFGPVLCVLRVPTAEAALSLVNANPYGNGAAIFTRSGRSARDFATGVQAGMVGLNVPIPVPMAFHSFGGWKQSLFGDRGVHGPEGVGFYTRLKTVTARWPAQPVAADHFAMPTNS